jgi:hypothetical protein
MLSERIQKVAESVLENEALISGLDRDSADVLQKWGVKNATQVAEKTATLDDERAEREMYPQLKASRRLIRAICVWLAHEKDSEPEEREKLWAKVEKRAKLLYGEGISLPASSEFSGENSAEFINNLRDWLETGGESDEKEKDDEKKETFFSSLFNR